MSNITDILLVNTCDGPVQGVKKVSLLGTEYISFQGIPYAEPPIGKLRFCDPEPIKPWTHIIDGSVQGPQCWGIISATNSIEGDEDCLHINVFTKNLKPEKPQPVMVYIHGGAYMWGSSGIERYSPDYLLLKDVVLVTLNYRLGAFGFLCIDDPNCKVPGNAGLKDQTLALKWVRKNVHLFGGDQANITLFGESAGGSAVHFQMISNHSRNLFHKAIVMSGCALNNWSLLKMHDMPKRLAIALGWDGNGGDLDVLEYLRSADPKRIVAEQMRLPSADEIKRQTIFAFGPIIEPYISEQCIIPEDPLLMARKAWSHDIPVMIGGTSDEGLFFYKRTVDNPKTLDEPRNMEFLLPIELNIPLGSKDGQAKAYKLKEFYFGDQHISMEVLHKYLVFITDKWFLHGLQRTCLGRLEYGSAPTYLYRFNYDSETFNHFRNNVCANSLIRGAAHADDLSYLFKNDFVQSIDIASPEYLTILRMVGAWTTFAETGNPNCKELGSVLWNPIQSSDNAFSCLNISDSLSVIDHPEHERMQLWSSLYSAEQLF